MLNEWDKRAFRRAEAILNEFPFWADFSLILASMPAALNAFLYSVVAHADNASWLGLVPTTFLVYSVFTLVMFAVHLHNHQRTRLSDDPNYIRGQSCSTSQTSGAPSPPPNL